MSKVKIPLPPPLTLTPPSSPETEGPTDSRGVLKDSTDLGHTATAICQAIRAGFLSTTSSTTGQHRQRDRLREQKMKKRCSPSTLLNATPPSLDVFLVQCFDDNDLVRRVSSLGTLQTNHKGCVFKYPNSYRAREASVLIAQPLWPPACRVSGWLELGGGEEHTLQQLNWSAGARTEGPKFKINIVPVRRILRHDRQVEREAWRGGKIKATPGLWNHEGGPSNSTGTQNTARAVVRTSLRHVVKRRMLELCALYGGLPRRPSLHVKLYPFTQPFPYLAAALMNQIRSYDLLFVSLLAQCDAAVGPAFCRFTGHEHNSSATCPQWWTRWLDGFHIVDSALNTSRFKIHGPRFRSYHKFGSQLLSAALVPMRLKRDEYRATPECKAGGTGRSLRKPVNQRHRPERFRHAKIRERPHQESNPVRLGGRRVV
ncbi:hypothetical protein PR048_028936 [Dryococelus australis]|uniref:Uncharacterized protein n=1 Tax=Dryococelus australis TaxID=614101 RepID=A0ABQ9GBY5_9NEOP|nr:hypothetical protein PR048_028936 [Dryococelus australis]